MDQEGNIISPLGSFRSVTRSSSSTTATLSVSSTTHSTTMATTVVTTSSARTAPAVPQHTAAAKAVATTTTTRCTSMVSAAVLTPSRQVVRAQVPDFRSSGKIPAHGWPPCSTGGVRLTRSQQKDQKISTLERALVDKDTTIARLQCELADITHNWEGQLNQLL